MRHLARKHGFSFLDIDALKKDFDKAGVFLWISMIFYDYLDYYQYGYIYIYMDIWPLNKYTMDIDLV